MTITAEPPSRTLPQYRHQPLHTPDSLLTSRLSVLGSMQDRLERFSPKRRWTSSPDYTASSPAGAPNCWPSGAAAMTRGGRFAFCLKRHRSARSRHGELRRSLPGSWTVAVRSPDRQPAR